MFHVDIIMLHIDINNSHVNLIMLHVDIIYLAKGGGGGKGNVRYGGIHGKIVVKIVGR